MAMPLSFPFCLLAGHPNLSETREQWTIDVYFLHAEIEMRSPIQMTAPHEESKPMRNLGAAVWLENLSLFLACRYQTFSQPIKQWTQFHSWTDAKIRPSLYMTSDWCNRHDHVGVNKNKPKTVHTQHMHTHN
ncbi:hypothetical protein SRHO_G00260820 [Serrasalmus rhombeus]